MTIIQQDDSRLRKCSIEVPLKEIASPHIQDIIHNLQLALHKEDDGVAIAAPQIGENIRIFVVNGKLMDSIKRKRKKLPPSDELVQDEIYINPTFIKMSKKKEKMDEGCLSVRWLYGEVERSSKATVEAYDEHGNKFEKSGAGLLAQVFQHEIDHLDGILFIDKAANIVDRPPETEEELDISDDE